MIEKEFSADKLYNKIVHFYIDKKGYTLEQANRVAQNVIKREIERRVCKNSDCRHSYDDHIRNSDTCLILDCSCRKFMK